MRTLAEINQDIDDATRRTENERLLELAKEAEALGTDAAITVAATARGNVALRRSEYEEAIRHLTLALELSTRANDLIGMSGARTVLGSVYNNTGRYDEAEVHYMESLDLSIRSANESNIATAYGNLGILWAGRGDYQKSIEFMLRGLEIEERRNDLISAASSFGNLGVAYYCMGDLATSLQYHQRALEVNERLGLKWGAAINTGNIGSTYVGIGDNASAVEYFRRAIPMHEAVGNPSSVARVTANLGIALREIGDHAASREQLQRAFDMHVDIDNVNELFFTSAQLINTLLCLNDVDQARAVVRALSDRQATAPRSHAYFIASTGLIQKAEGDLEGAHASLQQALDMITEIGASDIAMDLHRDLRDLAKERRDLDGYVYHNEQHLKLKEQNTGRDVTTRLATMNAERAIAAERAEREKERAVLHSALPKHIVERVLRGDDVSGDLIEDAAVLFLDIVGFTVKSANMPPKELTKLLSQIFTLFDGICAEHDVTKIKTIGDSYMAVAFPRSSPSARNDSTSERAAQAALAMMASSFTWPSGEPVQFRVGIHAGPVVAGVLGSDRLQYDVWGDTVNTASRLEGSSEPGRIQVSEAFAWSLAPLELERGEVSSNTSPPGPLSSLRGGTETTSHVIPSTARNDEHGTWHVALRGEIELKGKGTMTTYWLQAS